MNKWTKFIDREPTKKDFPIIIGHRMPNGKWDSYVEDNYGRGWGVQQTHWMSVPEPEPEKTPEELLKEQDEKAFDDWYDKVDDAGWEDVWFAALEYERNRIKNLDTEKKGKKQ